MQKRNYQKEMEKIIEQCRNREQVPTLLLHSCCAPCSSAVLERLSEEFQITVLYYNPNIAPREEYEERVKEQERLIKEFPAKYPITFFAGEYDTALFYQAVKGMEQLPEGGERCFVCYELRLRETAKLAKEQGFDFFTTTLSISPLKKAEKLNEIGGKLAEEYGIPYLFSDFKKKEGYKRSIALSAQYGLYRQDYCGCVYSLQQRREQSLLSTINERQ